MPKRQPLQTTFEGGVLSPLMYGRSELPGYSKSAKQMVNMVVDSRGAAESRNGLEYQFTVGEPGDKYGRLFTFRATQTQTFIVIITPTLVQITDRNGLLEGTNKIINGNFIDNSDNWSIDVNANGSVTFPEDKCRLSSGSSSTLADTGAAIDQEILALDNPGNTHIIRIDSQSITSNAKDVLTLSIGTAQGLSDILSRNVGRSTQNFEIQFTPGVANIWVRLETVGSITFVGDPEEPLDFYESNVRDINSISIIDLITDPDAGFVSFPSPWNEDQLHDLQAEMAPDLQRMYFAHRQVPVYRLNLDITVTPMIWSFEEVTFDWTPGIDPWQDEYPGAITFFQSRLYLASTVSQPVTIWGSKPGKDDYENFSDAGGSDPDDPIKVILARNADIQWMQGSKVLYVGCDNSEHVITSDGPAVINSDIETQQQSAYGSARIKTDWISTQIASISWDQRRLRLINFNSDSKNIDSGDLTFPSEHLTKGLMLEVQHSANPVNRLWTPLGDGTFLSCTLEVDYKMSAWTLHRAPGSIKSMTVLEEQSESVPYALTLRNNELYLLRMGRSPNYMDEYVERGYANPTTIVDRLEHLEGVDVQVIGDGNLYPNATVVGGQITVDGPSAINFVVGIIMPRLIETMNVDEIGGGQSSAASMKGWNRIYVRVLDSVLPLINGKRPPDRTPSTPMDEREPNKSQDIRVQNVGWDYDGTIVVEQNLPFNLTVTGIYGELSEDNL